MRRFFLIIFVVGILGLLTAPSTLASMTSSATGGGWIMNNGKSNFGFSVNHGTLETLTNGGPWYYYPNGQLTYIDNSMPMQVKGFEIWRFKIIPSGDGSEVIFGAWVQVNQGNGWSPHSLDPSMAWWARIIAHDYGQPGRMDTLSITLWQPGTWNINTETGSLDTPGSGYYSVSSTLGGGNIQITPP